MTLDEAIIHAEEVAEEEEKQAIWLQSEGNSNYENCVKRAKEHRQLAEWLKELKRLKEKEPCEDAVSRENVIENVVKCTDMNEDTMEVLEEKINKLPSVTPQLKQEPCDDCVSRQVVLDYLDKMPSELTSDGRRMVRRRTLEEYISDTLPSVTPQPEIGRWIKSTGYDNRDHFYTCSECGRSINLICGAKLTDYPYCHCGAKMKEV